MKSFKNLLDKIMLKLGYIPKQEYIFVRTEEQKVHILEVSHRLDNRLTNSNLTKFSPEELIKMTEMKLANELLLEANKFIFIDKYVDGYETCIKMSLKVIKQ